MQIDILSSNTLKLTLSRLDMFDLDIKYESLSGKNPETKRLLAHVLKSIRLDQKVGFDFTCERIFVEAFPRPDGGCMLYVSSLEADGSGRKRKTAQIKNRDNFTKPDVVNDTLSDNFPRALNLKREYKSLLVFETENMSELGSVCKCLNQQKQWNRLWFESALFLHESAPKYRLIIKGGKNEQSLISGIVREFGEVLKGEREYMYTKEHFKPIIEENAAEKLADLL